MEDLEAASASDAFLAMGPSTTPRLNKAPTDSDTEDDVTDDLAPRIAWKRLQLMPTTR
jgi:hypothetical protein